MLNGPKPGASAQERIGITSNPLDQIGRSTNARLLEHALQAVFDVSSAKASAGESSGAPPMSTRAK
jgi:hypothetical protein